MKEKALKIVVDYISNLYKSRDGEIPQFEVHLVWMCKTLQNWKFLISSTLLDGKYYELTYNGDRKEWYLDAYQKFDNKVITDKGVNYNEG